MYLSSLLAFLLDIAGCWARILFLISLFFFSLSEATGGMTSTTFVSKIPPSCVLSAFLLRFLRSLGTNLAMAAAQDRPYRLRNRNMESSWKAKSLRFFEGSAEYSRKRCSPMWLALGDLNTETVLAAPPIEYYAVHGICSNITWQQKLQIPRPSGHGRMPSSTLSPRSEGWKGSCETTLDQIVRS